MKKRHVKYEEKEENVFALSTGDLMAGLLFIFILLLMGALLQVQKKAEQDEEIVNRYDKIKTQLYIDLQKMRVRDNFRLKECQLRAVFDMHRQSLRFVVEEAVCGECRTDVHDEVVHRAVS